MAALARQKSVYRQWLSAKETYPAMGARWIFNFVIGIACIATISY
jgi:hypothetical protein